MNYKYQYTDEASRKALLEAHTDLILIAEENLFEGNFLTFTDTFPVEQLQKLQDDNTQIKLALAELAEIVAGGVE